MTVSTPPIHTATTAPLMPHVSTHSGEIRICSVYPVERRAERRHKRHTTYILPAAPRDSYSICRVFDTVELTTMWSEDGTSENRIMMSPIPVDVVANDLVYTWSGQTIAAQAGHGPGIGIIAAELPTDEELAKLREKQRQFFEWLVQDANDKHLTGRQKDITGTHRSAAYWLRGEAAQQLPWYPKEEHRAVKDCPRCARQILKNALGCEHCSLDLIDWYTKYPNLEPDPHVSQFLEQIAKPKVAIKPPVRDPRQAA
jgi:hypothetical protein